MNIEDSGIITDFDAEAWVETVTQKILLLYGQ